MDDVNKRMVPVRVMDGFSPGARYDLNLAVLTHCGERNLHRIARMKRWGVMNAGRYRTHVTLIVNPGDFDRAEEISEGWVATADVSVVEMPCARPIPKINGYYLWLERAGFTARWHGRVDDDSMTDVAGMLGYLDGEFGGGAVHVAGGPVSRHENEPLFVPMLLEHGIFIDDTRTEYESSFTSEEGMRRILGHERGRWLIEESGRRFSHPGDRALAFAAHVSGVRVVESGRSIFWFDLARFSLCGGDVCHIHYVPWHDRRLVEELEVCFPDDSHKRID